MLIRLNMFKPSSDDFARCFFCGSFLLFMIHICLCYAVLSVPCSLMITCWERLGLLALLYITVVFFLCFVTFPYGASGKVWYLIVSIPDLCFPFYFYTITCSIVA